MELTALHRCAPLHVDLWVLLNARLEEACLESVALHDARDVRLFCSRRARGLQAGLHWSPIWREAEAAVDRGCVSAHAFHLTKVSEGPLPATVQT